ncbi:N-acetylmuramoyl-L-alanine amidase [Corynebacterium felinum]|nr:N-acetylmuramoyl-L-alanine amidase [Corynebacterium felinum]
MRDLINLFHNCLHYHVGRFHVKQRRRLTAAKTRPITATVLAAVLVAGTTFGISNSKILQTQGEGIEPIDAALASQSFDSGENVTIDDPAIEMQGEGEAARTVKQFHRDQEFSMFALTWQGSKDLAAFVRGQRPDGSWTEWFDTEPLDYGSSDPDHVEGTDLIFVEPTKTVQVSISGVDFFNPEEAKQLDAIFIDGGESDIVESEITLANDAKGLPKVISRKGWGADESIRCGSPQYSDGVAGIAIHHTAGSNNYTQAQAPGIMRGIYKYHAQTLGWCDIGYHALADKYGNLYEGRYGGLNKDVIGAHAGGFNENTWAISMIGNYQVAQPTGAMIKSVGELAGWRAKVEGLNPSGKSAHYSEGTKYTQYPKGTRVDLPNIFAHRDVGLTECPGDYAYAQMGTIRSIAQAKYTALNLGVGDTNNQSPLVDPPAANNSPAGGANTTTGGGNAGTLSDAVKLLTNLQGLKNNQNSASIATAAVSLIALAIGVVASSGKLSGLVSKVGNVEVVKGLSLSSIPPMLDKLAALSGDSKLSQLWKTLSPILGKVRSGEISYTNGDGRDITYQLFDNGIIVESEETGAQALWGVIGDMWAAQGFDMGPLGLPVNMEYKVEDKIRVDFEGGYITFDPATGDVDIQAKDEAMQAGVDTLTQLAETPAAETAPTP